MTPTNENSPQPKQDHAAADGALAKASEIARYISAHASKATDPNDYENLIRKLRELESLFDHGLTGLKGDLKDGPCRKFLVATDPSHSSRVETIDFSADGTKLVVANENTSLCVLDLTSPKEHPSLLELGHSKSLCTQARFMDDRFVALIRGGSESTNLTVMDSQRKTLYGSPRTASRYLGPNSIADLSSTRDHHLAISSSDCYVRLLDFVAPNFSRLDVVAEKQLADYPERISLSPDGSSLLVAEAKFKSDPEGRVSLQVVVHDPVTKKAELAEQCAMRWPGRVTALAFSPDGRFAAIGGSEGELRIMDASSIDFLKRQPLFQTKLEGRVGALDFNLSGSMVAVAADKELRVFSTAGLSAGGEIEPVATFTTRSPLTALRFNRDGSGLAVGEQMGRVFVFGGAALLAG